MFPQNNPHEFGDASSPQRQSWNSWHCSIFLRFLPLKPAHSLEIDRNCGMHYICKFFRMLCVCRSMCVHVYNRVYIYTYVLYMYIYICNYVVYTYCVHTYIYIHTYIHTYIHVYIRSRIGLAGSHLARAISCRGFPWQRSVSSGYTDIRPEIKNGWLGNSRIDRGFNRKIIELTGEFSSKPCEKKRKVSYMLSFQLAWELPGAV